MMTYWIDVVLEMTHQRQTTCVFSSVFMSLGVASSVSELTWLAHLHLSYSLLSRPVSALPDCSVISSCSNVLRLTQLTTAAFSCLRFSLSCRPVDSTAICLLALLTFRNSHYQDIHNPAHHSAIFYPACQPTPPPLPT